jgi:glycosyltransferase involved in cell wall biosynthesis
LQHADLLTVPSRYLWEQLTIRSPQRLSKAVRWAPGVDAAMFAPDWEAKQLPPTHPFTFVIAGSLIPVKGHELLIQALANLRRQAPGVDVRLVLAGAGPLLEDLCRLVRDHNLEGYVTFLGGVRYDMLPDLFRDADCFLLSSHHEAQCMALLEAMSCGLPWIAPRVGAVADLEVPGLDGRSGIVLSERTPEAVARAMLQMVSLSHEQWRAMGETSRRFVEQHYDARNQAVGLLNLVRSLTRQAAG